MLTTLLAKRDFYAGGLMTALGAAIAIDSATYDLGTLTHMGPGMFPLMLGIMLAFVGLLIIGAAVPEPVGDDERILPKNPDWRGWGCIIAGPILFIAFGEFLGLIPAIFACVFVAAMGDRTATVKSSALLALGITIFGTLLFSFLLKIPFALIRGVWL